MTVLELIEELQALAEDGLGDAQVWSTYNYGDYHSTEALVRPRCATIAAVTKSAYSESGWSIISSEAETYEDDPEPTQFGVVLGKFSGHHYISDGYDRENCDLVSMEDRL